MSIAETVTIKLVIDGKTRESDVIPIKTGDHQIKLQFGVKQSIFISKIGIKYDKLIIGKGIGHFNFLPEKNSYHLSKSPYLYGLKKGDETPLPYYVILNFPEYDAKELSIHVEIDIEFYLFIVENNLDSGRENNHPETLSKKFTFILQNSGIYVSKVAASKDKPSLTEKAAVSDCHSEFKRDLIRIKSWVDKTAKRASKKKKSRPSAIVEIMVHMKEIDSGSLDKFLQELLVDTSITDEDCQYLRQLPQSGVVEKLVTQYKCIELLRRKLEEMINNG
ncbi:MAG: hypothetical protein ACFFD4_24380 [Candidatus Odinarchaeota archaeon]